MNPNVAMFGQRVGVRKLTPTYADWIDVGEERLRGGGVDVAARAVDEARRLDASTPGIEELQERVRVAARP